jgi:FkbM family methyltransferase
MKIFKDDLYIGKSVKAGYAWDRWMIPILEQIDHTGKVIIDIGANIGACALMFSYYAPVYAYEPFHIDVLTDNCKQDTKYKVTPIGKALSDKVETRKFYHLKTDNPTDYGSGTFNPDGDISRWTEVDTITSTTLDDDIGDTPVSMIKIDCQGNDIQVLFGAKILLEKYKPVIIIEICEETYNWGVNDVIKFISKYGYTKYSECPERMFYFE